MPQTGTHVADSEDMKESFVLPGAGEMPLACRVHHENEEAHIQLIGSCSIACLDVIFRESVSVLPKMCTATSRSDCRP